MPKNLGVLEFEVDCYVIETGLIMFDLNFCFLKFLISGILALSGELFGLVQTVNGPGLV